MTKADVMPSALDSEREVLAGVLLDKDCALEVLAAIRSDDFHDARNAAIFKACLELERSGKTIDPVLVMEQFERPDPRPFGSTAEAQDYIAELLSYLPLMGMLRDHIEQLKQYATRRRLISASRQIYRRALDHVDEDVRVTLDKAEHDILAIGENSVTKDFAKAGDALEISLSNLERVRSGEALTGVSTGFPIFDAYTSGLHRGEFVIIGARPAVGKTSFALNMAAFMAGQGHPVGLFSLEMQTHELMNRLLCSTSRVRPSAIVNNIISDAQWTRIVTEARHSISNMPLYIDDSAAITPIEMRAKARRLKRRHGLEVIFLDYLQLMSCGSDRENRQQEISQISRDLKAMAKDLDITVVALSQLSRKTTVHNGPPALNDLRESGALEQDADLVAFLYDPNAEARQAEDGGARRVSLIISKQRNGPVGEIPLTFDPEITTFEEIAGAR